MRIGAVVVALAGFLISFNAAAADPASSPTPAATPPPTQGGTPQGAVPNTIIYLKDGSVLRGTLIEQNQETLTLRTASGDLKLAQSGIARVDFGKPGEPIAPVAAPTPDSVWDATQPHPATVTPIGPRVLPPLYIDVDFFTGLKGLNNGDWDPIGQQLELGVQSTVGVTNIPVKVALDFITSTSAGQKSFAGDYVSVSGSTTEYAVGGRYIMDTYLFRGFAGAGVALVQAHQSADADPSGFPGFNDQGSGAGVWAGAGGFFRLGRHFNLGGQLRISTGTVRLGTRNVDAGGTDGGIFFGWGFGGATRLTRR